MAKGLILISWQLFYLKSNQFSALNLYTFSVPSNVKFTSQQVHVYLSVTKLYLQTTSTVRRFCDLAAGNMLEVSWANSIHVMGLFFPHSTKNDSGIYPASLLMGLSIKAAGTSVRTIT